MKIKRNKTTVQTCKTPAQKNKGTIGIALSQVTLAAFLATTIAPIPEARAQEGMNRAVPSGSSARSDKSKAAPSTQKSPQQKSKESTEASTPDNNSGPRLNPLAGQVGAKPAVSNDQRYEDLQTFSRVMNLVQQIYVEPVDSKTLLTGAIRGMLKELDPHSTYLTQEILKEFESETSGQFGGLGIEISIQNGILTVISPIEDTPAHAAGVKAGDKILFVDGKSTKGVGLAEASTLLRGKRGTTSVLRVLRDGVEQPIDIKITRGNVRVRTAKLTELDPGYHYIRITSFIENTSRDLEKILAEISSRKPTKEGEPPVQGVILDLRRNPGGLLDQAIKVSDLFLSSGTIVSTVSRDPGRREVARASGNSKYSHIPLIVLINETSASASEIVAGALQDNKRAVVMGEKSFGKGSVQSIIPLGDGSGLKLTVARYYTPSGRSIQADGIMPDILLQDIDSDAIAKSQNKGRINREKDIAGHLRGENEDKAEAAAAAKAKEQSPKDKLLSSDFQLQQAYNH